MRIKTLDWIALTLIILGAANWGLIGFFQMNLAETLFGGFHSWASRLIYGLVGLAAVYCLSFYGRLDKEDRPVIHHGEETV